MIASSIAQGWLGVDFSVDGFWPAFWGAILISIVSFLLSIFIREPDSDD
jgi:putative membrane protein